MDGTSIAQESETIVSYKGVEKTYDGKSLAVRDLTLGVRTGEFLTFLGPSGSGKTTSLLMLAGFEMPSSGDIMLNGSSITRVPPYKRNFGMVFQNYALFPHMTVLENVAYPLRMRRIQKIELRRRASEALSMVRLVGYEDRKPSQLSGGQQQRVALARALVFEPTLILMDEPLGALDKNLREQMQLELKHLHDRLGNTVIYVTHDQSEALTMSDRIAVFNAGSLQQVAKPNELYENPLNSFVANFIGENNSLHGVVRSLSEFTCQVELPTGQLVHARRGNVNAVGAKTTISLRPESVELGAARETFANRFEARVAEVIYLGNHSRYRLSFGGTDSFHIRVPTKPGASRLMTGETVEICWHEQSCISLDPLVS